MNRVVILMYHIVDTPRSQREEKYCIEVSRFEAQMRCLREAGYNVITLEHLVDCLDGAAICPDNCVVVTFDDGFASTVSNVLPILAKYQIPATMFVVADRVDGENDWMYSRGFPRRDILSHAQLMELKREGICIGSHTLTHPRLPELDVGQLTDELRDSRLRLEEQLGDTVDYFAYPYGLYNTETRDMVEELGYRAACSTRSGFNRSHSDRYALKRIEIYGSDTLWQFKRKIKFGTNDMPLSYPLRYWCSRAAARLGY